MMQPSAPSSSEAVSILLLAAQPAARSVHEALSAHLGATVETSVDYRSCQERLERQDVGLLLVEETFVLEDQAAAESLYAIAGGIPVLEINFGTSDAQRIVRQVRSALHRRSLETQRAKAAAIAAVRNDLSASVSGLLLESQFALRQAGPDLAPRLQQIAHLAEAVSRQLRS